ncbi:TPA: asparagine synthetase B [Clostridioides difficile]|nr:asparagine synthetase B [Clostridioides difficile]
MINLEEKYSIRKDTCMIKILEYNGHIRNWKVLCEELGIDSSLCRDERERAILVEAYKTWGYDMANHMHGMFAFALWDTVEKKLFCLRDQFGVKPFYYYKTENGKLLYGSSIRKIMEQPGFVKELNEDMLQIYMSFTYVAGENTFFRGVKKLMPGHYLVYQNKTVFIGRSLQKIMPEVKSENETAELFLSGGVDSSYILAMSDIEKTGSCGYEEEWFDESKLAQQTADILGCKNSRYIITPEEYFASVPYVMYHMEQPTGDASAIVFAIGCKAAVESTSICYSGEGADEFFGGYNIYHKAECYGENLKKFYIGNTNIMNEGEKRKILKKYNPDVLPIKVVKRIYEETEELDTLTNMSNVDIQIWLEGDIYFNIDKMSTAVGLEVRMPLTDTRIFDIASRIPSEYKVKGKENKIAFRTAASKTLPEEIAFRNKLGFIVPIRIWMADDQYNKDIRDKFNSEIADKFFNIDEINEIFNDYISGNSDNWRKIWMIYTFLVWYEIYFVKC